MLPQTFAAWGGAACIVIGMLVSEPDIGRAMLAVLLVHAIHVLTSLTLVIPAGSRVVLSALRPTVIRFVLVQAIAQPLTEAVSPEAEAPSTCPIGGPDGGFTVRQSIHWSLPSPTLSAAMHISTGLPLIANSIEKPWLAPAPASAPPAAALAWSAR